MKPVFQTEIGGGRGNCVSACVASILELSIEGVPNFRLLSDNPEQVWIEMQSWLSKRGLCAIRFPAELDKIWTIPTGTHCILTGNSPNFDNLLHAVVGYVKDKEWKIVHDPNPSQLGLKGDPHLVTFFSVVYL